MRKLLIHLLGGYTDEQMTELQLNYVQAMTEAVKWELAYRTRTARAKEYVQAVEARPVPEESRLVRELKADLVRANNTNSQLERENAELRKIDA